MNIEELKQEIPYQWRVQSFSKNKAVAQCVAYIDARDVMDLLDRVCGVGNWQDEYYQVKNTMCCKIGIKINDQWVWKTDGGSETDVEAEKGELSDAFKRAAVKWGVGRFLYSLAIVTVDTNGAKTDNNKYPFVVNESGSRVWNLTEYINSLNGRKPQAAPRQAPRPQISNAPKSTSDLVLPPCKCGGQYVKKQNRTKGTFFYSCNNYPNCKAKAIDAEAAEQVALSYAAEKAKGVFSDGAPLPSPEDLLPF